MFVCVYIRRYFDWTKREAAAAVVAVTTQRALHIFIVYIDLEKLAEKEKGKNWLLLLLALYSTDRQSAQ